MIKVNDARGHILQRVILFVCSETVDRQRVGDTLLLTYPFEDYSIICFN